MLSFKHTKQASEQSKNVVNTTFNKKYWIKKANDKHQTYCIVSLKEFSVARQVIKALDRYAEGKGHKGKCEQSENKSKLTFVVDINEETVEEVMNLKNRKKQLIP